MNYIDLFSGIGGFALGAYWAGMRFDKHYFSEVDKDAVELYRKRCPDAIPLGDITKIDWKALADANTKRLSKRKGENPDRTRKNSGSEFARIDTEWIITGGFPCQDLSVAGKGAGLEGERSGLWSAMFKAIRILRPRYVIIENVGAIVGWFPRGLAGFSPDRSPDIDGDRWSVDIEQYQAIEPVLDDLNSIGYNAEWQDIRAGDMGAPHKRERIWIVAYPKHIRQFGTQEIRKNCGLQSKGTTGKKLLINEFEGKGCIRREKPGRNSEELSNPDRKYGNNAGYGTSEICRERPEQAEVQRNIPDTASVGRKQGAIIGRKVSKEIRGPESCIGNNAPTARRSRPGEWLPEPCMGVLVDGLPAGMDRFEGRLSNKSYKKAAQIKGIGNSILPQIAELFFRMLKDLIYKYYQVN